MTDCLLILNLKISFNCGNSFLFLQSDETFWFQNCILIEVLMTRSLVATCSGKFIFLWVFSMELFIACGGFLRSVSHFATFYLREICWALNQELKFGDCNLIKKIFRFWGSILQIKIVLRILCVVFFTFYYKIPVRDSNGGGSRIQMSDGLFGFIIERRWVA
jgi:hypothetical protein